MSDVVQPSGSTLQDAAQRYGVDEDNPPALPEGPPPQQAEPSTPPERQPESVEPSEAQAEAGQEATELERMQAKIRELEQRANPDNIEKMARERLFEMIDEIDLEPPPGHAPPSRYGQEFEPHHERPPERRLPSRDEDYEDEDEDETSAIQRRLAQMEGRIARSEQEKLIEAHQRELHDAIREAREAGLNHFRPNDLFSAIVRNPSLKPRELIRELDAREKSYLDERFNERLQAMRKDSTPPPVLSGSQGPPSPSTKPTTFKEAKVRMIEKLRARGWTG